MYSSNVGRWPGSDQPAGERMCAMLRASVPVLIRPTTSSIRLGGVPRAATRTGFSMSRGMVAGASNPAHRRHLKILQTLSLRSHGPVDAEPLTL